MSKKAAREILLANGITEEQLNSDEMKTLLSNPTWCSALEREAERADNAEASLATDLDWYQTQAAPALKKATEDLIAAKGEAASYKAQLEAAQATGLLKIANQGAPGSGANPSNPGAPNSDGGGVSPSAMIKDPNTGQFLTLDQFNEKFNQGLSQVGDVVAMAADIPLDHRDLFGTPLPGGMAGLRREFNEARTTRRFQGSIMDFWNQKYNVQAKREEVAKAAHQKELDAYAATKVKEREAELISQYGNPQTRPMSSSRSPFTNRGSVITGAQPAATPGAATNPDVNKQPWDKGTREQRSQQRVTSFVKRSMEKAS